MITSSNFKCDKCGKCCLTYTVKLSGSDIKKIEKIGLKKQDFAEEDNFDVKFGKYALKRVNDQCIFLEKKGKKYSCKIYENRPAICRNYPFNESKEVMSCKPTKHNISKHKQ
jgi:Fe-S-cluster containining protein